MIEFLSLTRRESAAVQGFRCHATNKINPSEITPAAQQ